MIEYVLVFAVHPNDLNAVLVVRKEKPVWQLGRSNLCGGKVEMGESPEQCAIRELKEESGLDAICTNYMGKIIAGQNNSTASTDYGAIIHCLKCVVTESAINPRFGETEPVFWMDFNYLKNDEKLMPNLRVIIPLMMTNSTDWIIYDYGPSWQKERHQFYIEVKSEKTKD